MSVYVSSAAIAPSEPVEADGLPAPRRYWSTLAIALGITLAVLDSAIANVALPTIARDLHANAAAAVWVVNAYQLAIVVALLPLAALGEIVGYRRIYQGGIVLFTLASLACAVSRSMDVLALARIVQGFGAAGVMSVNGALVRYTNPHARLGRAIGVNAMVVATASALGPTVASAILSVARWPWLFGVNVPIGIAAIVVASLTLPHTPKADRRFDWPSALLNAAAFGFLVSGAEVWGRGMDVLGAMMIAAGVGAGIALVLREAPRTAPLVPLDLLRIRLFSLSVGTSICSFAAQMLALVSLPFFFEGLLGRSAVETGLLMTPWPVAVGAAAPVAGRLADRFPAGLLGGIGMAVLAFGLAMLALLPAHASDADIVWRMACCGVGFGLFQSPNNRTMMSSAPRGRSGAAGGMLATARLIGQTAGALGVAILFRLIGHPATTAPLIAAALAALAAAAVSLSRLGAGQPETIQHIVDRA